MRVLVVLPFTWSHSRPRSRNLWPRIHARSDTDVEVIAHAGGDGDMPALALPDAPPSTRVPFSRSRAVVRALARGSRGDSLRIAYADAPAFRDAVQRRIERFQPDVVYVERRRGLSAVRGFPLERVVLDPTDSLPLYYRQVRQTPGVGWRDRVVARVEEGRIANFERRVYARLGAVIACTERDARAMTATSGRAHIDIVANGVNLTEFTPAPTGVPPAPATSLVMTGNFRMLANADAAEWLIEAWPMLRAKLGPGASLTLAGGNPGAVLRQAHGRDGITVTGFLPRLREAYWKAGIAVAPIRLAVGTQNKIIEPMAAGVPVVTTPEAAAGMPDAARACVVVASRERFIESISALAADAARRAELSCAGRAYVTSHLDWDVLAEQTHGILCRVAGAERPEATFQTSSILRL